MIQFELFMCLFLIICVLGVLLTNNLLNAVIIYTAFGMGMSVIWVILQSPDVAITEVAAGTGITAVLFYLTLRNVNRMEDDINEKD